MLAKASFQENLVTTVLRTDRDGDFQFNETEARRLCMRMKNQKGVNFDEDRVRQSLVQSDNSVQGFLQILRDINEEEDEEEEENNQREDDNEDNRQVGTSLSQSSRLVSIDQRQFMNSVITGYSERLLPSTTSGSGSDSGSTLDQR